MKATFSSFQRFSNAGTRLNESYTDPSLVYTKFTFSEQNFKLEISEMYFFL